MNQKTAKHLRRILRKFKGIDPKEREYTTIAHKISVPYVDDEGVEQTFSVERPQQVLSPESGRGLYRVAKRAIA